MSDSYSVLLSAVIKLLRDNATLTTLVNKRIYSELPSENQEVFPYCHVEIDSSPFGAKDFSGMTHNVTVKCFSKDSTPKQASDIRSAIYTALDRIEASTLALSSGHMVRCDYTGNSFIFKEDDGITWQGVIGFTIIIN